MIACRSLTVFLLVVGCAVSVARSEEPSERTAVYLIDPRIVTLTRSTLKTHYGDDKTDIIASRTLTKSEARALWVLLDEELSDDTDVPFCGHSPAYAIQLFRGDKLVSSTSVCGLCMTWARKGEFKKLKGKKSLAALEKLIALPDVFVNKSLSDLSDLKQKPRLPFYELDAVIVNAQAERSQKHGACDMEGFMESVQQVQALRQERLLTARKFAEFRKEPNTIVLDARGESDFKVLHVTGSKNLPYTSFGLKSLRELIPDTETRILIYCRNNLANKAVQSLLPYIEKSPAGGLNIPTSVALYSYGYSNVWELDEIVDPSDCPIPFDRSDQP